MEAAAARPNRKHAQEGHDLTVSENQTDTMVTPARAAMVERIHTEASVQNYGQVKIVFTLGAASWH